MHPFISWELSSPMNLLCCFSSDSPPYWLLSVASINRAECSSAMTLKALSKKQNKKTEINQIKKAVFL